MLKRLPASRCVEATSADGDDDVYEAAVRDVTSACRSKLTARPDTRKQKISRSNREERLELPLNSGFLTSNDVWNRDFQDALDHKDHAQAEQQSVWDNSSNLDSSTWDNSTAPTRLSEESGASRPRQSVRVVYGNSRSDPAPAPKRKAAAIDSLGNARHTAPPASKRMAALSDSLGNDWALTAHGQARPIVPAAFYVNERAENQVADDVMERQKARRRESAKRSRHKKKVTEQVKDDQIVWLKEHFELSRMREHALHELMRSWNLPHLLAHRDRLVEGYKQHAHRANVANGDAFEPRNTNTGGSTDTEDISRGLLHSVSSLARTGPFPISAHALPVQVPAQLDPFAINEPAPLVGPPFSSQLAASRTHPVGGAPAPMPLSCPFNDDDTIPMVYDTKLAVSRTYPGGSAPVPMPLSCPFADDDTIPLVYNDNAPLSDTHVVADVFDDFRFY